MTKRQLRHRTVRLCGVHGQGISQRPDTHEPLSELVDHVQGVPDCAAQPVQGVQYKYVAGPRMPERVLEPWAGCGGP